MGSKALIIFSFLREKQRKNTSEEKKKRKKKDCAFACLCVELSLFIVSNTVYQRIELT